MALRCLLGKMGNNNKLGIVMLVTSQVFKHKIKELLSMGFPTHSSPPHFGDIEPMATRKAAFDYHSELGGLRPARFALEEFNKLKKTQLQFLRVVGLWMKPQGYRHDPCRCLYVVLIEAVDAADGLAHHYQARVQLHDSTDQGGMCLEALHLCCKKESCGSKVVYVNYKRLYHCLDNFYDVM